MSAFILAIHVVLSLMLVGLILIQHGKGADAGAAAFGGGNSASLFGSQGSASFLSRASALLAVGFFVTSLTLAYLAGSTERVNSVTEIAPMEQQESAGQQQEETPEDLPDIP